MNEHVARWIGPIVAILIAIISASVSIGSQKAEILALNDRLNEVKKQTELLTDLTHKLDVQNAKLDGTMVSIDRSLVEIKEDIKDLKRVGTRK